MIRKLGESFVVIVDGMMRDLEGFAMSMTHG